MAVWLHAVLTLAPEVRQQPLVGWLHRFRRADLDEVGGRPWGLWDGRCGLGFGVDEVILMSVWPDDASAGAAVELMKNLPDVIAVNGTPLHPVLRPMPAQPVAGAGIWGFSERHLAMAELNAYLRRSGADQGNFETSPDHQIVGLFRCPDVDAGTASLLLLTHHPDMTAWKASQDRHATQAGGEPCNEDQPPPLWSRSRGAILQGVARVTDSLGNLS